MAPTHLKSFLAIKAAELLVVHDDALAGQKDMEPSITEPPTWAHRLIATTDYD